MNQCSADLYHSAIISKNLQFSLLNDESYLLGFFHTSISSSSIVHFQGHTSFFALLFLSSNHEFKALSIWAPQLLEQPSSRSSTHGYIELWWEPRVWEREIYIGKGYTRRGYGLFYMRKSSVYISHQNLTGGCKDVLRFL
jgi:hypothetical protein